MYPNIPWFSMVFYLISLDMSFSLDLSRSATLDARLGPTFMA